MSQGFTIAVGKDALQSPTSIAAANGLQCGSPYVLLPQVFNSAYVHAAAGLLTMQAPRVPPVMHAE